MKQLVMAAALAMATVPALAQVGVSIGIGDPDFFGQIVIGNAPPPRVVYARPVIVAPGPYSAAAPIYLRVPPREVEDWRDYCERYDACGRPVYFVRDDWYRNRYVPYYRGHRDGAEHRHHEHQGEGDGGDGEDGGD